MLHRLSIDLETYSSVNIGKAGSWKYIESPDFEILLFAYSLDGAPPVVVDLAQGETIPPHIVAALTDPAYIKKAYNAPFEWGCRRRKKKKLLLRCPTVSIRCCRTTAAILNGRFYNGKLHLHQWQENDPDP